VRPIPRAVHRKGGVRLGLVRMLLTLHAGTCCLAFSACLVFFVWGFCVVKLSVIPQAPQWRLEHLGTHAPVPLNPLEYSTSCVSQSLLRLRAFRWHVCACVQIFVRPANWVIKHKVLCVCVFGPCFLCTWTISVTGCHVGQD